VNPEKGRDCAAERVTVADLAVVAGQLGRFPRSVTAVAVRCPFDYPGVIETAPMLAGAPNPTLFYLTCPALVDAVSGAEAAGAVKELRALVAADPEAALVLRQITRRYRERRASLAGEHHAEARLEAGIGGPSEPEKAACLHAYAAALLAVMSGWLRAEGHGTSCADAGGVTATDDAARAALPSLDPDLVHFEIRVASRIWSEFLPSVDDIWCRDGRCVRFDVFYE
jgi:hypothetical protein